MWILTKLPFLGTLVNFVTGKKRLLIEYAMIAVVLMIAGFTFNLWLSKKNMQVVLAQAETELVTMQSRLTTVEFISATQEARITDLSELRLRDAHALTGLLNDYRAMANSDSKVRARLQTLETNNETVRDYLNSPIPPDLKCLLNNTCKGGNPSGGKDGERPTTASPDRAVRTR